MFVTSPYFHIGADEVWLAEVKKIPEWQAYKQQHGLDNDHDVYNQFIVRMHELVKCRGRRTLVWEGFNDRGQVKIPKDILVMIFENAYFPANVASAAGYTLINTSWQPIYVVNKKSWSPSYLRLELSALEKVFDTTPPDQGTQLAADAPAWEPRCAPGAKTPQTSDASPPAGRHERADWNPDAGREFDDYQRRAWRPTARSPN